MTTREKIFAAILSTIEVGCRPVQMNGQDGFLIDPGVIEKATDLILAICGGQDPIDEKIRAEHAASAQPTQKPGKA